MLQLNRLPRSVVAASSISSVSDNVAPEELLGTYRERASSSSEGSSMTMPRTESPILPRPNYWNSSDAIESSSVIKHEHPTCQGYSQSRFEREESSTRSSDQTLAEMGGNHSESSFAGQIDPQPGLIPDTPSTPGTLPHQTERSSSGELLPLGFSDELIEEMVRYSRGRYRCRLCEDWVVPGTTITATGLFVARVHIVKLCRSASVELKTRLLELDLEIDRIPGQHDTLYLAYLNDFTLDRLQSRNSRVIPLAGV